MIPAPFMVDANGVVSTDVCYELEQIGDGAYILKVEADASWFGQAERAYPVMIDPTIRPTYTIQDCCARVWACPWLFWTFS